MAVSDIRRVLNLRMILLCAACFAVAGLYLQNRVLQDNGAGDYQLAALVFGGYNSELGDSYMFELPATLLIYVGLIAVCGIVMQNGQYRRMQVLIRCRKSSLLYCAQAVQGIILCAAWCAAGAAVTALICLLKYGTVGNAFAPLLTGAAMAFCAGCALFMLLMLLDKLTGKISVICGACLLAMLLLVLAGEYLPQLPVASASYRRLTEGTITVLQCVSSNLITAAVLFAVGVSIKRE